MENWVIEWDDFLSMLTQDKKTISIQDDYHYWDDHGRTVSHGKPLPYVDGHESYFFDDNIVNGCKDNKGIIDMGKHRDESRLIKVSIVEAVIDPKAYSQIILYYVLGIVTD
jgi:hypothetical protein